MLHLGFRPRGTKQPFAYSMGGDPQLYIYGIPQSGGSGGILPGKFLDFKHPEITPGTFLDQEISSYKLFRYIDNNTLSNQEKD